MRKYGFKFFYLFVLLTFGCFPKPVEDKGLICKDPNDPESCPAKKISLAREQCIKTVAAEWSELKKTCKYPKSYHDCQSVDSKFIWDGTMCKISGQSNPTYYELCSNPDVYPDLRPDMESISKFLGYKTCQENYDYMLRTKRLQLNRLNLKSIRPFLSLSKLEHLDLWDNKIRDISLIGYLNNLKSLNLGKNLIIDLSALKNLKKLEELLLFDNEIYDPSIVFELKKLKRLDLSYNKISDINPFLGLNLENGLLLEGNPKLDKNLDPVSSKQFE